MDFGSQNDMVGRAMHATQTTVATANTKTTTTEVIETDKTMIEEIREKGFRAFVEQLQEEKKEELRKKILASMGYSEEDLQKMPAEQRAQIEKLVEREIMERMVANAEMNGKTNVVMAQEFSVDIQIQHTAQATSMIGGAGMGPLLALQEALEDGSLEPGEPGEKDKDAG